MRLLIVVNLFIAICLSSCSTNSSSGKSENGAGALRVGYFNRLKDEKSGNEYFAISVITNSRFIDTHDDPFKGLGFLPRNIPRSSDSFYDDAELQALISGIKKAGVDKLSLVNIARSVQEYSALVPLIVINDGTKEYLLSKSNQTTSENKQLFDAVNKIVFEAVKDIFMGFSTN